MKTVGQIIDHLDEHIERLTANALNPDRAFSVREHEIRLRRDLVALKKFITEGTGD